MDKSTHQVRCEHWLKLINDCLSSGMKKNEWCKVHGVSEKAFYYWQRILRNEAYIDSVVPKQTSLISLETPQEVSFVLTTILKTDLITFSNDMKLNALHIIG